jgi:general secretion pathway protein G
MKKNVNLARGFTLIEIMVVVVILGILAAIVVPRVMNRPEQTRVVRAHEDIAAIENAMDLYKLDNGYYPSTDQGVNALVSKPSSDPAPQNWHQYLKQSPTDPWGHTYQYLNPGVHGDIDIFTYGPTGQPGGTGDNAEIGNWNLNK